LSLVLLFFFKLKGKNMTTQINQDSVIAIYSSHHSADAGVGVLIDAGFNMQNFSVVGKGYHTDEKTVGFYNTSDRMKFWGKYGAF
jgi:hypothetical protein